MAPVRKIQVRTRFAPWLSNETKKLMKERDYAQLRASESKENDDISDYKNLRNRVNNRLKKEKKNWKKEKLNECGKDSGKIWKNILGWLNWKSSGAPTQIFYNGSLENKPARIAACINEFFVTKVHTIIQNLPQAQTDPLKSLLLMENDSLNNIGSLELFVSLRLLKLHLFEDLRPRKSSKRCRFWSLKLTYFEEFWFSPIFCF